MVKKAIIFILVILALAASAAVIIYIYRYRIFQYSAERAIRSALPDYVEIDKINFELEASRVVLKGFKIANPPGFSYAHLIEIEEIVCRYRMKGKNIFDGIEALEPNFKKPVLSIERLADGSVNVERMQKVLDNGAAKRASGVPAGQASGEKPSQDKNSLYSRVLGDRKISDLVKLPQNFNIKDGKIIFLDKFVLSRPYTITFENIDAELSLKLNDDYSKVLRVGSKGRGNLNGFKGQVVKWNIEFNPTAPKLTMSNRFEVSGLDILTLEPYYDKYSPFIFKKGKFSGTLVFDFDNGNIGSTNEIRLSDFLFYIKSGYENSEFWQTTVPDLSKYLTTSFGEIVFDFKIKGEIGNPKFYLGPIAKQAVASMAVDRISSAIQKMSGAQGAPSGGPKSDIEKVKDYVDMFKGLMKK